MEKDAAIEKRRYEKKVKEAEDKALKELKESKKKKRKKKGDDKDASKSKEKPDEHDVGVSVRHDHVRHGKVFYYGGNPLSSSGRSDYNVHVDSDLTDTDVPGDEDFLVDWDERSEIENAFGPKATWTKDKGYDFESGKVVVAAPRSYHPKDSNQSECRSGG